jgi:hypothetical protein
LAESCNYWKEGSRPVEGVQEGYGLCISITPKCLLTNHYQFGLGGGFCENGRGMAARINPDTLLPFAVATGIKEKEAHRSQIE